MVSGSTSDLVERLRLAFPEIEDRYQEELRSWSREFPGNYNVFAFVFKPYLQAELARENNNDFLVCFCGFMEEVCSSQDKDAVNVVWLKIFKLLLADPAIVKRLWPFMGASTKANLADAALRWGMVRSVPAGSLIDGLKHWVGLE